MRRGRVGAQLLSMVLTISLLLGLLTPIGVAAGGATAPKTEATQSAWMGFFSLNYAGETKGKPSVHDILTANIESIHPGIQNKLTYQWYRVAKNGGAVLSREAIVGATGQSYTIAEEDGKALRVTVTSDTFPGTVFGYAGVNATALPGTLGIRYSYYNNVKNGTAKAGQALSANVVPFSYELTAPSPIAGTIARTSPCRPAHGCRLEMRRRRLPASSTARTTPL